MGFDPTPNGTTGARQPGAGRVMRWINRWAAGRIRKGCKFLGSTKGLMLTTIGPRAEPNVVPPSIGFRGLTTAG